MKPDHKMVKSTPETSCPMDNLLRLLTGPWTTYVLWVLRQNDTIRFGQLKKAIPGISSRLLTNRLRRLEAAGLVRRQHKPTIPPQVSYSLTARGQELNGVLDQLNEIARRWQLD
jgi:DNA-binding HxlR family transcriptional regulator